jgi:ABC-2 type transport system ATP-binding protein
VLVRASLPEDRAIETHDLSKKYGDRLAVDRLNLTVASKQVHGFLGPNGAGKSTTIKMMVGLLRPTSGNLSILGEGVSGDNPKVRRKIGYMPELPRFPKHLSGEELLDVYGRMYGMSKTERKARIPDLVKMVGLEGRGKDRIGKYSKGMQQRIGIAQALISSPELVILDEPSIGLDPVGMVEVRNMVKDIVKSGTTVFFSSHLLAEVQQVCDHVTVIHLGVMRYSGTLEDIASKVTARRRLVIELDKPVDGVLAALKTLNKGTVEAAMNTYTIHLDTREDIRAEVSRAITGAGGVVVSMREEGGGLEDAFLSLVGKDGLS